MANGNYGDFDTLNFALFAQMDRLLEAENEEAVLREIERSRAVSGLAKNIISNYQTAVGLMKLQAEEGMEMTQIMSSCPKMLGGE